MIVARVQAHPSRVHLHEALALGVPTEVFVHSSEPPDPWANYRACLTDIPECDHLLVIQDDALPCKNFSQALEAVASSHSEVPVCLFMGSLPSSTAGLARRAMVEGQRYIPLGVGSFVPLVAVLWPKQKAQEFLHWSQTARGITRADDGNAARWVRQTKQQVMVSVPSLVQHNDFIASVKGGRDHVFGAESWRRALFLAEDGLDYEW